MNSMEGTALVVEAFESRVQRRTSQSQLSLKMGHARSFLVKALGHERGPRTADMLQGLIAAGDELPGDLYHQAFERASADPSLQLACNRRRQGLPHSPFLLSIAPRVLALISEGASDGRRWRSQLSRIRGYERLRFRNRQLSQDKLEWSIDVGLRLLEGSKSRPSLALTDLACAMTSLAVCYMVGGRLDDALDALLLAYPLISLDEHPLAEGLWFQKSAYLLVRLDRCDRAAEFVKEASMRFLAAAARGDQIRTLVDLGHVLSRARFSGEACRNLLHALRLLPQSDREYLCAAHQILAGNLARLGKLEEATAQLESASRLATDSGVLLASIHWSRAKMFLERGQEEEAADAFRCSLSFQKTHGNPADLAAVAFEFAALLLKQKKRPELEKLAAEVLGYLAAIPCDRGILETVEDFAALVRMKALTAAKIKSLHSSLPEQGSTGREAATRKTRAQPPGWISQPISSSSPVSELLFGGRLSFAGSPTTV